MRCRHCQNALTRPFLDLGSAPPSNSYLSEAGLLRPETWYPLRVMVCEHCWLVQTEDYAGREALFAEDYAYFSSFSTSWLRHARTYVEMASERFRLDRTSLVVEVASNDGYLLQYVKELGIPCLGIEPTSSTARAARVKGIEVVEEFFGIELAERLVAQGLAADLTVANNVLAHVPDINDFVAGFQRLLKPSGVATFEFPHLLRLVDRCQFDTVYHEHFSYLSLTSVLRIMSRNGLEVFDVEECSTHGGSLRVFAQQADGGGHPVRPGVAALARREQDAGMQTSAYYSAFQAAADRTKNAFLEFMIHLKQRGATVASYGAAAKGNTLLNYAGIKRDLIPWVVDLSPAKQGKYLPGSRIPVVDEERLKQLRPEYIVILPWNLRPEITAQLDYARDWGAKFVTAIPELAIT